MSDGASYVRRDASQRSGQEKANEEIRILVLCCRRCRRIDTTLIRFNSARSKHLPDARHEHGTISSQ